MDLYDEVVELRRLLRQKQKLIDHLDSEKRCTKCIEWGGDLGCKRGVRIIFNKSNNVDPENFYCRFYNIEETK